MAKQAVKIPNALFFAEVKEQLKQGRKIRMRVRGNSMFPFLRNNEDEVLIESVGNQKLRKGTIVLAETDELGIVMHRIIRIEGKRITLSGDGNLYQIEHTTPDRVFAITSRFYWGRVELNPEAWPMRALAWLWYQVRPYRDWIFPIASRIKHFIIRS